MTLSQDTFLRIYNPLLGRIDVVRKLEMGRKSGKGERSERSRCNESMIGSQRRKKVLIELFLVYEYIVKLNCMYE